MTKTLALFAAVLGVAFAAPSFADPMGSSPTNDMIAPNPDKGTLAPKKSEGVKTDEAKAADKKEEESRYGSNKGYMTEADAQKAHAKIRHVKDGAREKAYDAAPSAGTPAKSNY